jgi:hypothetical protein
LVDNKKIGKPNIYSVGTTVRLLARNRTAYFVGLATLNASGVAHATFEDLKTALPMLWECVTTRGNFEPLIMPVLGSGFSRLTATRAEIIREIVTSFIAACSSSRPTEALTIVMPPKDVYDHDVDLEELRQYIQHVCQYTDNRLAEPTGPGQSIR